jgi:hypothetical protein
MGNSTSDQGESNLYNRAVKGTIRQEREGEDKRQWRLLMTFYRIGVGRQRLTEEGKPPATGSVPALSTEDRTAAGNPFQSGRKTATKRKQSKPVLGISVKGQ